MTVRTRLLLTFLGLTLLLILPAGYGLLQLRDLRNIAVELERRHAAASVALGRLESAVGDLDRFERAYIATGDSISGGNMMSALAEARQALRDLKDASYDTESSDAAGILTRLDSATISLRRLVAHDSASRATQAFQDVKPLFDQAQAALDPVAQAIDQGSAGAATRAQHISATATATVTWALLVALLVAIALGLWITGALTGPIHKLQRAMGLVAKGTFRSPPDLPYDRRDELGDLTRSFRSMTEQLEELQRIRAEFVSIVSHELKTPLNVIGGYAEILEEGLYGEVGEQQREALETIRSQVQILAKQVDQLLSLSRFESGSYRLEMGPIRVEEVLSGVERVFRPLARQREIDFTVELRAPAPERFQGDSDRLRNEVLGNLLSNAFKFTGRGGRIRLSAEGAEIPVAGNGSAGRESPGSTTPAVRFEVSDTGSGIPPEDLQNIFDKYYQSGELARQMGTGLGLAIAREIVEAHGGRIRAESDGASYTTFYVDLPLAPPGSAGEAAPVG